MANEFTHPEYLVETNWLQTHLDDPNLRILDATVFFRSDPRTGASLPESGRANWEQGHIPNSTFIDLIAEISAPHPTMLFMAPTADQFASALGQHGVADGTRVVVYDANNTYWATRVWWLLRAFGFDNVAVLNGGWKKWQAEVRPISTAVIERSPTRFIARPRPELFVEKDDILREINAPNAACLVNTLGEDAYRSQRIPSSINMPFMTLVNPDTGAYLPADDLREIVAQKDLLSRERVILYCLRGISATSDAFILTLLGVTNIAVYDGSMQEWTADVKLPIQTG